MMQVLTCQAQANDGVLINRLEIAGTQRRLHLETQVGDTLDRARISREVHRLWSSGWFDDIRVEATPEQGGVGLAFYLVEKPRYVLRRVELKPSTTTLAVKIKPGIKRASHCETSWSNKATSRLRSRKSWSRSVMGRQTCILI